MRTISRKKMHEFFERHPDAHDVREPLDTWYRVVERADWRNYADLKAIYATADVVGKYTVINLCGNKYRIILEIFYESAVVLVRHVLTHKEYDSNSWRKDAHEATPGRKKKANEKPDGGKPPKRKEK